MLVMTDDIQKFVDEQVATSSDEVTFFLSQQVEKMLEDDPDGLKAEAVVGYWYESKRTPVVLADKLRLKFASHLVKTLIVKRYTIDAKRLNYWALVNGYQRGNTWRQLAFYGEIVYRVSKVASEGDFIDWLQELMTLPTGEEIGFFLRTPERFVTLTR